MSDHTYLAHHGIKGMKWGVRRYRNKDGSLTEAGKQRYADFASQHNAAVVSEKHYGADAKTLAYMAKRLNSAYYDSEDDDLVIDALETLYGRSSGVGHEYRNASESERANIVGKAYKQTRDAAAIARGQQLAFRAMDDAMKTASDNDIFGKKAKYWNSIAIKELDKQMPRLSKMTATELMLDMDMRNEYTERYNKLFNSQGASTAAIRKHVSYDSKGRIVSISKELEDALGAPLSTIDDPELVELVAQQLEAL